MAYIGDFILDFRDFFTIFANKFAILSKMMYLCTMKIKIINYDCGI